MTEAATPRPTQRRVESASPRRKSPAIIRREGVSPSSRVVVKPVVVPQLSLEEMEIEKECSEMIVKNKKPSLMTKTILELEKKEAAKQAETERLLRGKEFFGII